MKQHRSDFPEEAELNYCNVDKVKFDLKEAPGRMVGAIILQDLFQKNQVD